MVIPGQDLIDQQRAILRFDDLVPQVPGAAAWYAAQQEQMAAMGMNPGLKLATKSSVLCLLFICKKDN